MIYIDDILLFAELESMFDVMFKHFKQRFKIMISKKIDKFLGRSVDDDGYNIKLHNMLMMERLLKHF